MFAALQPAKYVAVDISVDFLKQALTSLQRQNPDLPMLGLGMDFSSNLTLPSEIETDAGNDSRLFFYPGSSIGNFTPADALPFLEQIHSACKGQGGLLIGVDLVKSSTVLQAAYDDALGVTAAFNRNMLLHINKLLGSNFNINQWQHRALFNTELSRIEMHLDALEDLTVRWPGGERKDRVFTLKIRTNTRLIHLRSCSKTRVFRRSNHGKMRISSFVCFGRRLKSLSILLFQSGKSQSTSSKSCVNIGSVGCEVISIFRIFHHRLRGNAGAAQYLPCAKPRF
jgi:hypothetical protein